MGLVIVIVIVRQVQRAERLLVRGLWVLDEARLRLVRLFLEEAVDFEPVRAATVPGARLRHTHHQALPQTARLARGAVLLVDHAHTTVLAFGDAAQVVVGATEERLWSRKSSNGPIVKGRQFWGSFGFSDRAEKSRNCRYILWNFFWSPNSL